MRPARRWRCFRRRPRRCPGATPATPSSSTRRLPAAWRPWFLSSTPTAATSPTASRCACGPYNSGEALKWLWNIGEQAGAQMVDSTAKWTSNISNINGYDVTYFAFDFGPKPYNTGNGMRDIADWAEQQGVEIFYSTPAAQLVQDESGAVTGVIAEGADGYIQFNAAKGVIVATGDYENDDEMMAYYEPAMANIYRKEQNKTGDGQKMMVWAGACMEDACGSKVQHDFDAGPGSMADMPFLAVKNDGSRFCNEAACEMAVMGNFLRSEADQGWYSQIFDSNYMADTEGWPGVALPPEAMASYMPEVEGEKTGVYESLINTFSADTLEELGQKLGLTDVDAFVKTVGKALQRAGREGHR
ncbi:MAG: FAD-binding protein [Adlercreutzia equolifaciens]